MKAAIHNLGCKTNAYEAEAMEQALKQAGYAKAIGLEYFPLGDPDQSLKILFAAMPIEE